MKVRVRRKIWLGQEGREGKCEESAARVGIMIRTLWTTHHEKNKHGISTQTSRQGYYCVGRMDGTTSLWDLQHSEWLVST